MRTHARADFAHLYGNVEIREVQLAFRQAGRLDKLFFDEGDFVAAQTPLAQLDAQPFQESLALAQANVLLAQIELQKLQKGLRPYEIEQARQAVNQAQAQADEANKHLNRQLKLRPSGASSQSQLDAAQAAYDHAAAGLQTAKAALAQALEGYRQEDIEAAKARLAAAQVTAEQAQTALSDTVLLAPSDGTISSRVREAGSMVNSQTAVYSLSLDSPVYVRAYINEPQLGLIAPGMTVYVQSDSSPKRYRGQIGFISPRAEFTPKNVETEQLRSSLVYRLRIVITDEIKGLRQGMPVTVYLPTENSDSL